MPTSAATAASGNPASDLGGHAMGIGGCQQVGQQCASVPPQVPPAPFPVLPTGTERDAGQHQGHVVAHVHTSAQRDQGVVEGVVVVHVVTHDIHLHRMEVARRHRRPEPDRITVDRAGEPGDTSSQEQQRAQQTLVEPTRLGVVARQHLDSRQR